MPQVAYSYTDPLLESPPDPAIWGTEIDRIYQDLGERHQFEQLCQDCAQHPGTTVLIRGLQELGNSVSEICDRLTQLETLGVEIEIITSEQSVNLKTIPHLELLHLLRQVQEGQQSLKIRQGHARNRLKAMPPPGQAPYGYRRGKDRYLLDRSTAPVVKDFFERFLLYGSLRGAVRYLEKKYHKKISVSTGHRWLTHPVYRGNLEYANGDVIPNTHAAILLPDEAAQIDRLLRRNRRLAPRTASAPRSLAGLVQCGECQSAMIVARVTSHRQQRDYLYLRPQSCPQQPKCKALSYAEVLEQTIVKICQELPLAIGRVKGPNLEIIKAKLKEEIKEQEAVITQISELIKTGILDVETANLRRYKIQTALTKLQSQLAQFPPVNLQETAQAVSFPQFWLDLSESERRFYFREFIREIKIVRQDEQWHVNIWFIFE